MIVPMKKLTLLVMKKYEVEAVGKLRKLGVMHIEHGTLKDSKDRTATSADFSSMEKIANALALYKGTYNEGKAIAEFGSGEGVFEKAKNVLDENDKLNLRSEELQRDIQSFGMWGNFRRGFFGFQQLLSC
jgi:vacuolar-type H+-ATPase subunit I/STV1